MRWLGVRDESLLPDIQKISHKEAKGILKTFAKKWPKDNNLPPKLRNEWSRRIADIVDSQTWQISDLSLLREHHRNLKAIGSKHDAKLQQTIASLERWRTFGWGRNLWATHAAFWLLLIFAYPKSPPIQAIFFWNPWVRRITGLGYVGFVLAWVPFLRSRLFAPFQHSLLADAGLDGFRPGAYFPNSTIVNKATGGEQAVYATIPKIKGQLILEGESGLGKTMFLRHIIQNALGRQARQQGRLNKLRHIFRPAPIIVFLPADRCAQGVSEAIQAKLHGMAKDPKFLRNLIYSGAIDICIDGLNEVTADTRAKITEFVESYFKGNIIMTTQPLEWRSPATATTFVLQPLARRQVDNFLASREPTLPIDAPVRGQDYREACDRYLTTMFHPEQNQEEQRATRIILSNPMDLTLVAQLLSQNETPDLLRLQEQQYRLMAEDYRQKHLQAFPLQPFFECVYTMRLTDQTAIPEAEFYHELQCMERHKMVTRREATDSEGRPTKTWHFRHDKIMEYFIVQTFLGKGNDRPNQHFDDPRFRGVYLLLAKLLPLPVAEGLQQQLVYYAADTRDHTVSDDFIQLVRSRSGTAAIA
ncbi:MAG: HEAT repeat domain-containing protein [Cyanobacteria bacterium P01_A01_bin.135]